MKEKLKKLQETENLETSEEELERIKKLEAKKLEIQNILRIFNRHSLSLMQDLAGDKVLFEILSLLNKNIAEIKKRNKKTFYFS